MNDISPILLLMIGLLALASAILWGLSIYVAARLARQAGKKRWPWVLLAALAGLVTGGPIFLGIGYLAHSYRRRTAAWVVLQVLWLFAVAAGAQLMIPDLLGGPPLAALGALLGAVVLSVAPVIVLGLLGPARARAATDGEAGDVVIRAAKLKKSYDLGRQKLRVLRGVSLSVKRGEFLAILGSSGSGKSTLLHLLGLLDVPDQGRVLIDGADCRALGSAACDRLRSRDIGFVFQFYHLLPEFNVLQNTLFPAQTSVGPAGWARTRRRARRRALEILDRVGLSDRLKHRPKELSGGEQQRVAIARALVNEPKILLADEPTGNLDSQTGAHIIELLKTLNQETEQTIVMVTHDEKLARAAGRVLHLRDGRLHGTT